MYGPSVDKACPRDSHVETLRCAPEACVDAIQIFTSCLVAGKGSIARLAPPRRTSVSNAMNVDASLQKPGSSMEAASPEAFLSSASASTPALRPLYDSLAELHSQKLFYQLLLATQGFFAKQETEQGTLRYDLYRNFVVHWKSKVSDLSVAELALSAAKQLREPQRALDFLSEQSNELPPDQPPHLLLSMEATYFKLLLGDLDRVKKDVDRGLKTLNGFDAVENVVSGGYYRVAAEYYKAKAMYQQYYTSSLLYLACLPHNGTADDLPQCAKVERAHDLAIAAILGQGIWNFGELVGSAHPCRFSRSVPT